jgi:hypothetical protein
MTCGKEFTVIVTSPYDGPDNTVATKLMEEAKIRSEEEMLMKQAGGGGGGE